MTEEKQNKLDTTNITSKANDIAYDCTISQGSTNTNQCFRNVTIAYIGAGNSKSSPNTRIIGVVLEGQTQPSDKFYLQLGFYGWNHNEKEKDLLLQIQHNIMLNFLDKALLTGSKVDICANITHPSNYIIVDVALKS